MERLQLKMRPQTSPGLEPHKPLDVKPGGGEAFEAPIILRSSIADSILQHLLYSLPKRLHSSVNSNSSTLRKSRSEEVAELELELQPFPLERTRLQTLHRSKPRES
ncbi:Hypothetical protein NTJ_03358 [Nesidiocoris tenuis]|uniref:Uncharacterized protein n=2 Tax=Nesidiocoris tenuis TaxID=355587 RepID=A0ABN7AE66_9HEMI|nr:Hypothetical protein NTJ_03358 [Nesidiocoris tenuis]